MLIYQQNNKDQKQNEPYKHKFYNQKKLPQQTRSILKYSLPYFKDPYLEIARIKLAPILDTFKIPSQEIVAEQTDSVLSIFLIFPSQKFPPRYLTPYCNIFFPKFPGRKSCGNI
jgi:hypothetical protein